MIKYRIYKPAAARQPSPRTVHAQTPPRLLWLKNSTPRQFWCKQKTVRAGNQFRHTASCRPNRTNTAIVVLVMAALVQFAPSAHVLAEDSPDRAAVEAGDNTAKERSAAGTTPALPKNVADMRDALLAAAQSGRIEELRTPYEWNELPPVISDEKIDDPIAYWKQLSRDGEGREILLILDKLLHLPPAKLHVGADFENSALYVWPYLAELDLAKLTPGQQF